MELPEPIEEINKKLLDMFGYFDTTRLAKYRVIWSTNEVEKRWTNFTDEGFELLNPEVRELPKYKQWCADRYLLERCVLNPSVTDLLEPYSYTNIWTFQDTTGKPLPPIFIACRVIAEGIEENVSNKWIDKFKQTNEQFDEQQMKEFKQVEEYLFGDWSNVGNALAHGNALSMADPLSATFKES